MKINHIQHKHEEIQIFMKKKIKKIRPMKGALKPTSPIKNRGTKIFPWKKKTRH